MNLDCSLKCTSISLLGGGRCCSLAIVVGSFGCIVEDFPFFDNLKNTFFQYSRIALDDTDERPSIEEKDRRIRSRI